MFSYSTSAVTRYVWDYSVFMIFRNGSCYLSTLLQLGEICHSRNIPFEWNTFQGIRPGYSRSKILNISGIDILRIVLPWFNLSYYQSVYRFFIQSIFSLYCGTGFLNVCHFETTNIPFSRMSHIFMNIIKFVACTLKKSTAYWLWFN